MVISEAAVIGVLFIVGLAVFFWKRNGVGSGRAFGNRMASHIGIPKDLFHSLLDHSVKGSSRELLAALEKENLGLDAAAVRLGPSLARGIERLEARFGRQDMVDKVKPLIAQWVKKADANP